VNDVAEHFGEFVNEQSDKFASGDDSYYPLVAPEGGKEPLMAEMAPFSLGSDHQVYTDSSFGIPAIYLNDWPDRYIHTNFDTPANVDPTKLKRAAFIGAASGYNRPTLVKFFGRSRSIACGARRRCSTGARFSIRRMRRTLTVNISGTNVSL
jgi:hypothetical protein